MSRTDRHRPWRVQQNDPYERHRWYRYSGHHEVQWASVYRFGCHGRNCCGKGYLRADRVAERHQARRVCRDAVKGVWE